MYYKISYENPNTHYIDIECRIDNITSDYLELQLPVWRPGRYELGNFAKNIQKLTIYNAKGKELKHNKTSKSTWRVETKGEKSCTVIYNYYAAELNAGSTWLDHQQLYVNPVNCLLYCTHNINSACSLQVVVPETYRLAGALNITKTDIENSKKIYTCNFKNFHELADTPFISSDTLKYNMFVLDGIEFNVWFQGECKPDWAKIIGDFFIFINEQLLVFKKFPVEKYHFLVQVLPYNFYHGVEHESSTVIAIGPSYNLMRKELYDEFLGVSSHELFHTWNVKNIRPFEMLPYKYDTENYATTGYIYEGITTYYGDLMLYRSGIFSDTDYFKTLAGQFQKHLDNPGRFNHSVSQSSFDTWLDGYQPGVPNRKVSIYTEGCLLAFIADALIRKQTHNKHSLDTVMLALYNDFGQKNRGYTQKDYQHIIENITQNKWDIFFEDLINGTHSYLPHLTEALNYFGLELSVIPAKRPYESFLGFKALEIDNETIVQSILPNSVAEIAGLCLKDKIIGVNGFEIRNNLNEWCNYFWKETFTLKVITNGQTREIILTPSKEMYYKNYSIIKNNNISHEQAENYYKWSGRKF
ncbi:MAG: M61 family metallopeptidase [Bacteroidia bacterium]|nr:M61 family metallopeptidase [Bacteroidia bacterium]